MAIGTTAAILGSAVIGAGASAISSSKNSKAIKQTTDAQTQGNAASLALQSNIYNQNKATLSPFVNRGNAAGDQLNALLGLGGAQMTGGGPATAQIQPNAFSQFQGQYSGNAGAPYGLGDSPGYSYDSRANAMISPDPGYYGNAYGTAQIQPGYDVAPQYGGYQPPQGIQPTATYGAPMQPAQNAQQSAFDQFRNSTGYQFRLGEGLDAVNSAYAGIGGLQSGAAMRGIAEYGQNFASNEFGNYAGLLSGQQGAGLQAAGAQAGVGVNYANAASNINQNNAAALSNAAVARANNSNAMFGGIANSFGNAFGNLAYQAPAYQAPSSGAAQNIINPVRGGFY